MNQAISAFDEFFERFKKSKLWIDMVNTREDSPWHREENVSVHTQMLIKHYKQTYAHNRSEQQNIISLVACLMHDIGKPPAQTVKFSEERGEYRTYAGHEQLSARMWVDYAMSQGDDIKNILKLSITDVANIAMMLEYHVPFGLKNNIKRVAMKKALVTRMGESGHQAWLDFIMCDQNGRISDGQAEKLAAVDVWMTEWKELQIA